MGEGEISESTVGLRAKPALSYEADYPLRDGSTEALTVGLSCYERDTSLDRERLRPIMRGACGSQLRCWPQGQVPFTRTR